MRFLSRILIVVAVLVVAFFLYLNGVSGEFKSIEVVEQGECVAVSGAPGAEDIDQHRAAGISLFSSTDRTAMVRGAKVSGGVYAWPHDGSSAPRLLTGDDPDIRPHGLSVVETGANSAVVFVVDHRGSDGEAGDVVQVYDWRPMESEEGIGGALEKVASHRDPVLRSLNDVAGLADGTFYATRDHGAEAGLARLLEDVLRLGGGGVIHWDGTTYREVADGIAYANGIAVDEENELVYVSSTTTGRILVFDRDQGTGDLAEREIIETGTGVDNLELDRFGNVWVGAHPKLLTFMRHAGDPTRRSPSEALWIASEASTDPRVRTVWRNEGEALSGSSVVVPVGGRLLIGSVFEPDVLVCERTF